MKLSPTNAAKRVFQQGFTLVELVVSTGISVLLGGSVVLLLVQSATEQRNGYAANTVEEQAYILESSITGCLRTMSANQGMSPVGSTAYVTGGITNGYNSVILFYPTNGGYYTAEISYNSTNGQVFYIPNTSAPTTQVTWFSNSTSAALTALYFWGSYNLDGSHNNSLINVAFEMSDNGFSQHSPTNNPANVFRSFSVQMRNE
jgi:type II secretory pathway pseudopilin PulG